MTLDRLKKIRNFGIIAHIDAGKTTTTERVLFYCNKTRNIGEVHEGEATTDYMEQEKERGITIVSAAVSVNWETTFQGEQTLFDYNIIDTPGHVDFTIEVQRSVRVLDGAVVVFDSVEGAQSQTITVWRQADKHKLPRILFFNKLDRLGADFYFAVQTVRDRIGVVPLVCTLPVGKEGDFSGVIDLIRMKYIYWTGKNTDKYEIREIPSDMKSKSKEYRDLMLGIISDQCDECLEKYLQTGDLSELEIEKCIRLGALKNSFFPAVCGSAYKNKGVELVLDFVAKFLPSPLEVKVEGEDLEGNIINVEPKVYDDKNNLLPFVALAFKIINDKFSGTLTLIRIFSGKIENGTQFLCNKKKYRIGRIVRMFASQRTEIEEAYAGDIVAVVGLSNLGTGDTLCDPSFPVLLEKIISPEGVISLAITPKTKSDSDKLSEGLQKLQKEDPSLTVSSDNGQTIITGMGSLHLEIIVDRLKREFNVSVSIGDPLVKYKCTLTKEGTVEYLLKKQTGGAGQFAGMSIIVKPVEPGKGIVFVNKIVGGVIPKEYISAIEKGIRDYALEVYNGIELIDFSVELFDGRTHDVDSSALAFEIAARGALREALSKCVPKLLEPIMKAEVFCPEANFGDISGSINGRRGQIEEISDVQGGKEIKALVPLSEMLNYINFLREKTQGRGSFSMVFDSYQIAPDMVMKNIEKSRGITL